MDENNNNDSKAWDTLKKLGKRVAKETGKLAIKAAKHIIKVLFTPPVLPYTIIVILCILALALILGIVFYVFNSFSGLLGLDADSLATSTKATVIQSQQMITIDSDTGQYIVNDEYSEKIFEGLELQQVDTENVKLVDIDKDMLNKYIEAEVKTMFPKTENGEFNAGEFDGLVKVHRDDAESGSSIPLNYIKYSDFYAYINNEDARVLKYFTLNPDDFKLHIAYTEKTEYKDYNENVVNSEIIIKVDIIDYQSIICNYATPLNYYISMHMICQDKDFMNELVDMVEETEIVLSFVQSAYKEIKEVDYEAKITTVNYETKVTGYDEIENLAYDSTDPLNIQPPIIYDPVHETTEVDGESIEISKANGNLADILEYTEYITPAQYHIIEKTSNEGRVCVTKANTWRLKSYLNLEKNDIVINYIQNNNNTNYVDIDDSYKVDRDTVCTGSYIKGTIDEYTSEWTESYDISINETEGEYDLTNFMNLIEQSYPKVKNKLETTPSMLFYLLEKNQNTQELSSVMRYVLFKFTGDSYGVTELDLADILMSPTQMVGSDYVVHIDKGDSALVIRDVETLKRAFSGYMGNEKLDQYAQDFLDMQEQYKVNAVFAAAVSIVETSAGRAGNAVNGLNNWFNISGGDPWKAYSSPREGIHAFGQLIANGSYYFTQGKYTVSQIGHTYCPNTTTHPTQADDWVANIIGFMTNMYKAAGIDANPNISTSGVGKIQDLINWAHSYVGDSSYPHWGGGYKAASGSCAAFVKSAYKYSGFEVVDGVCGKDMLNDDNIGEIGEVIYKNGEVDWSNIPIGAFLVVPPGADGSNASYGHTALYVGDGYVIEAGGSVVKKNQINVNAFSDAGYSYWAIPKTMKDYINSSEYKDLL